MIRSNANQGDHTRGVSFPVYLFVSSILLTRRGESLDRDGTWAGQGDHTRKSNDCCCRTVYQCLSVSLEIMGTHLMLSNYSNWQMDAKPIESYVQAVQNRRETTTVSVEMSKIVLVLCFDSQPFQRLRSKSSIYIN